MELKWIGDAEIAVTVNGQEVLLSANRDGLLSLANHLTTLALDTTPGAHIHLDEYNALEDGSSQLIIQRTD